MFKEIKNEHFEDCISTIAYDPTLERFAIGLLDERLIVK